MKRKLKKRSRKRRSYPIQVQLASQMLANAETTARGNQEIVYIIAHRINQYRAALMDKDPSSIRTCPKEGCMGLAFHEYRSFKRKGKERIASTTPVTTVATKSGSPSER